MGRRCCIICSQVCNDNTEFQLHMATHLQLRDFLTCGKCEKRVMFNEIHTHITDRHPGENPRQCEVCNKVFDTSALRKEHGYRLTKCAVCKLFFSCVTDLRLHIEMKPICIPEEYHVSHADVYPKQCHKCEESFSSPYKLQNHMWSHLHIRPFQCDNCNRMFSCSSLLTTHLVLHCGMEFRCNICARKCTKENVFRHVQSHIPMVRIKDAHEYVTSVWETNNVERHQTGVVCVPSRSTEFLNSISGSSDSGMPVENCFSNKCGVKPNTIFQTVENHTNSTMSVDDTDADVQPCIPDRSKDYSAPQSAVYHNILPRDASGVPISLDKLVSFQNISLPLSNEQCGMTLQQNTPLISDRTAESERLAGFRDASEVPISLVSFPNQNVSLPLSNEQCGMTLPYKTPLISDRTGESERLAGFRDEVDFNGRNVMDSPIIDCSRNDNLNLDSSNAHKGDTQIIPRITNRSTDVLVPCFQIQPIAQLDCAGQNKTETSLVHNVLNDKSAGQDCIIEESTQGIPRIPSRTKDFTVPCSHSEISNSSAEKIEHEIVTLVEVHHCSFCPEVFESPELYRIHTVNHLVSAKASVSRGKKNQHIIVEKSNATNTKENNEAGRSRNHKRTVEQPFGANKKGNRDILESATDQRKHQNDNLMIAGGKADCGHVCGECSQHFNNNDDLTKHTQTHITEYINLCSPSSSTHTESSTQNILIRPEDHDVRPPSTNTEAPIIVIDESGDTSESTLPPIDRKTSTLLWTSSREVSEACGGEVKTEEEEIICNVCEKQFKTPPQLLNRFLIDSTRPELGYICDKCVDVRDYILQNLNDNKHSRSVGIDV